MKSLIRAILIIILILLASYITISYGTNSYTLRTFTIEDSQENTENPYTSLNTYTIPQEQSGRDLLTQTIRDTEQARKRNLEYKQREEEIDKCIKKLTKNWKRTYYKRSYEKVYDDDEDEWVYSEGLPFYEKEREFYGYDKDEDWRLRWRLKNRALNGEKIC